MAEPETERLPYQRDLVNYMGNGAPSNKQEDLTWQTTSSDSA